MASKLAFRWLTVFAVAAACALMLHAGDPASPGWWPGGIAFAAWVCAPLIAPYGIARRAPRWRVIAMLVCSCATTGLAAWAYGDAMFRSKSSTAALVFVFVPLYQWLALAAIVAALALIARIRRRSGSPPPSS